MADCKVPLEDSGLKVERKGPQVTKSGPPTVFINKVLFYFNTAMPFPLHKKQCQIVATDLIRTAMLIFTGLLTAAQDHEALSKGTKYPFDFTQCPTQSGCSSKCLLPEFLLSFQSKQNNDLQSTNFLSEYSNSQIHNYNFISIAVPLIQSS